MISTILLIIIYIAFISLGLPDSIMGVSWPSMRMEFGLPIDQIGLVSIIITISTVISSLLSGYLIQKLGTGKITLISVLLTALALIGISFVPSFYWIMLLALPLGFGAGSIDTALNNFVANHYKAHHMNWLHSFWGVGATVGPIIMAITLAAKTWRQGFLNIGIIQLFFFVVILLSIPLWKKVETRNHEETSKHKRPKNLLYQPGVLVAVSIFIVYCAIEFSVGLWTSSYLVQSRNFTPENAATIVATYYAGITLGRFICGFLSFKLSNKQLIYIGLIVVFLGVVLINFRLADGVTFIPYVIIGLGLAPIFPAMIHETPVTFGKDQSQYVIGYQMAGAYLGGSIFPPLFGITARLLSIKLFPFYLLGLGILLLVLINALYFPKRQKK